MASGMMGVLRGLARLSSVAEVIDVKPTEARRDTKPVGKSAGKSGGGAVDLVKSMSGLPSHLTLGVQDVVASVTDYLKVAEQQQTRRAEITAQKDVAIATIEAQRACFSQLLDYTFKERASVLGQQFKALDHALHSGNAELAATALQQMVAVIQTSPFRSMQEMQSAMGQKDFVVRLD